MYAWIIYGEEDSKKNAWYIEEYKKVGKKLGVQFDLLLTEKIEFGVEGGTWYIRYQHKELIKPDFAIVRTIYPMLSKQLEYLLIPVYNNAMVAEICNNKARTYQYLARLNIPMVDTRFLKYQELDSVLSKEYLHGHKNQVIKSVAGHGGNEVFLLHEEQSVQGITSDFVLQPRIGTRCQDLRVYVLGKSIIGAILRTAKEGFKSNYSLGGNVREYHLSNSERSIVEKIIQCFDFGLVGIDFILADDQSLLFNEIEDVVGARMLYQCTNYPLVEHYIKFILEREALS